MKQDISIKGIKKEAKQLINQLFGQNVEYILRITMKLLVSVTIRSRDGKPLNQIALDTFNHWLKSINAERQVRMFEKVQHFVFDTIANITVEILSNFIDCL
jgi:hypothetical protein